MLYSKMRYFLLASPVCVASILAQDLAVKRVYINDSEIYVGAIGVPEASKLTSDKLGKSFPRWSPDGKRIAYVEAFKTENIFTRIVIIDIEKGMLKKIPVVQQSAGPNVKIYNDMRYVVDLGWMSNNDVYLSGSPNPKYGEVERFNATSGEYQEGFDGGFDHTACGDNQLAYLEPAVEKSSTYNLMIHRDFAAENKKHGYDDSRLHPVITLVSRTSPYSLQWSQDCSRLMVRNPLPGAEEKLELVIIHNNALEARTVVDTQIEFETVYSLKNSFAVKLSSGTYLRYLPENRSFAEDGEPVVQQWLGKAPDSITGNMGRSAIEDVWHPQ